MLQVYLKIYAYLRDKPGFFVSSIAIGIMLFYAYGCTPKTDSLINPQRQVSRAELQIEIDTLFALSKARFEDIAKKEQFRQWVFEQGLLTVQTGNVNPVGLATSLFGLFGIGATADNIRLRKQRKNASQS